MRLKEINQDQQKYNIKHSQNFIQSSRLSRKVVELSNIGPKDVVIEIGPGKGALTKSVLERCDKLIAIEKDKELYEELIRTFYGFDNLQAVNDDFMNYRLPATGDYKVIGNIPFAFSTAIIKKLLNDKNPPKSAALIVQKEFAERVIGSQFRENFFSLEYKPWFRSKVSMRLSKEDLFPMPNVDIVLLQINKYDKPLLAMEYKREYLDFIAYVFMNSIKGMNNSLGKLFTHTQMKIISKENSFNFSKLPTEVTFEAWLDLFNVYLKYVSVEKRKNIEGTFRILENKQKNQKKTFRTRQAVIRQNPRVKDKNFR